MTLRARLQGPLLWTVSVVTLLALMFGVARLVPEQPYLALLVAVVVLMLGLTLADPTVIPLLAMPVLLVVVRVSAGGIQEMLGQQIRHLDRDPLSGMVTSQQEYFAIGAATIAEPQRPDRPVLDAAPDLMKFGDIRMLFGQSPQILLQLLG